MFIVYFTTVKFAKKFSYHTMLLYKVGREFEIGVIFELLQLIDHFKELQYNNKGLTMAGSGDDSIGVLPSTNFFCKHFVVR